MSVNVGTYYKAVGDVNRTTTCESFDMDKNFLKCLRLGLTRGRI